MKGDKWTIYELVVRRFLATVAPPAHSESRNAVVDAGGEKFVARGYKIIFLGWRKYYPYIRVTESSLPQMTVGDMAEVSKVDMERLETKPPQRYTQGTLLQEMEKLNLGTKSTRHEIIQKLYDRKYAIGNDLVPTESGNAVVEALEKHAKIVTESKMTAHLEIDMDDIANGKSTMQETLEESQDMLSDVLDVMEKHRQQIGDDIRKALAEQNNLGICPSCGGDLRIIRTRKGTEFIGCSNYPQCDRTYRKPTGALVQPTDQKCEACQQPMIKVIRKGNPLRIICIDPDCETNKGRDVVGPCPECGKDLKTLHSRAGKRFLGCSGYPECKRTYPLPQFGTIFPTGDLCELCKAPLFGMKGKGAGPSVPTWIARATRSSRWRRKREEKTTTTDTDEVEKTVTKSTAKKAPAKKPAVKKAPMKPAVKSKTAKKPAAKKAAPKEKTPPEGKHQWILIGFTTGSQASWSRSSTSTLASANASGALLSRSPLGPSSPTILEDVYH